jgi:S1/P1 Nuclease
MRQAFTLIFLLSWAAPAPAWNDHGHMVVARLAWLQLTPQQRAKVGSILKHHPHYEEFLVKYRPNGFSEDEWEFLRAATWPDWVRDHHAREYARSGWHFVDYPVVPPGSRVDARRHEPPPRQENVVNVLPRCVERIKDGGVIDKAVNLCWLLHLTGDIHQPLHCASLYSEIFPTGDNGGNASLIRIRGEGQPVNLHSFWDGLLGRGDTAGAIGKDVQEIQALLRDKPDLVRGDLAKHTTFEAWAHEGAEVAKKSAYRNGELRVIHSGRDRRPTDAEVHVAPADYGPASGRVARVQVGKAGMRLAEQLEKLFP